MAGVAHPSEEVLASFVDRNGIVDDGGRPLKLVLARLRKTHKAEWYRRTNGQMEQFAIGHTAEVAANHYADIPALRALHEETVAAGLQDALDLALIPRVVLPEALMRTAPESAGLPVPPDEVIAFLDGSQDLWLASCSGFYASPFSDKGHPCPVSFWGCLDCGNAVITSRKLPSLIAFLSFMGCRRRQHCGQPGRLALQRRFLPARRSRATSTAGGNAGRNLLSDAPVRSTELCGPIRRVKTFALRHHNARLAA